MKIFIFILGLFFVQCSKPFIYNGFVTYAYGQSKIGDRVLKDYDKVTGKDTILISKKSIFEVTLREKEKYNYGIRVVRSPAKLRIKEKSPETKDIQVFFDKGTVIAKILRNPENAVVEIVTPAMKVSIQREDSIVKIEVAEDGTSNAYLMKGIATARKTVPAHLHSLSDQREIREFVKSVEQESIQMSSSSNQRVHVSMKDLNDRIHVAKLDKLFANDKVKKIISGEITAESNPKEYKEAVTEMKKFYKANPDAKKVMESKDFLSILKLKVEKVDDKELKKQLEESDELAFLDEESIKKSKNIKEAIQKQNEKRKEKIIKTIKKTTNEIYQKVKLPNGQTIEGTLIDDITKDYVIFRDYQNKETRISRSELKDAVITFWGEKKDEK